MMNKTVFLKNVIYSLFLPAVWKNNIIFNGKSKKQTVLLLIYYIFCTRIIVTRAKRSGKFLETIPKGGTLGTLWVMGIHNLAF